MKDPIEVSALHLGHTPHEGRLRVDLTGVHWKPSDEGQPALDIDVGQIAAVNMVPRGVAIDTPGQRYWFQLAEDPSAEVVRAVREAVAAQFGAADELRFGEPPRTVRGARRTLAFLSVNDMSTGDPGGTRQLIVLVAAPNAGYTWKGRVPLGEDVHQALVDGFDKLADAQQNGIAKEVRRLGQLLLNNTLTAPAVSELRKISPGIVNLNVDELLAHLPWGVVHDGLGHLLLEFAVSQQISSIAPPALPRARAREQREARKRILILADPTGDLPATMKEAQAVQRWFRRLPGWDVVLKTGAEVNRVAVMSLLGSGDHSIIHYAGHSEFNPGDPMASALLLSDGRLTAEEVRQNLGANPPSLVYASSCEGGRGGDHRAATYGRRLSGLTAAFLSAGVKSYVGFFWPIPDDGADRLATEFYDALLVDGQPAAEALRVARRKLSAAGDPLLWGGAMLFGDGSATVSARAR